MIFKIYKNIFYIKIDITFFFGTIWDYYFNKFVFPFIRSECKPSTNTNSDGRGQKTSTTPYSYVFDNEGVGVTK